ncbi:MAG: EscU/YscU/HrcU family type III secretion system export apparatus switch protein, partial [Pseudomonadota bacterium]
MAEESDLEKTEPASQRRLDDARAQGTIARSPELSAFAVTMSALAMMWFSSEALITGLKRTMTRGLTLDLNVAREPAAMSERLYEAATSALTIGGPLLGVTVLAALLAPLAIGGFAFVPAAIGPRYSRIDPMAGLSRMFSLHGVTELGKALLKAGLIGGVGALVLWNARERILALAA